jgi:hypothetical protein
MQHTNKYSWVKKQQVPAIIDINQNLTKFSGRHALVYADAVIEAYLIGLNTELTRELAELQIPVSICIYISISIISISILF